MGRICSMDRRTDKYIHNFSQNESRVSRENMGASTSHKHMDLHGLLQGQFTFLLYNER
jgi:hypothetical protein